MRSKDPIVPPITCPWCERHVALYVTEYWKHRADCFFKYMMKQRLVPWQTAR